MADKFALAATDADLEVISVVIKLHEGTRVRLRNSTLVVEQRSLRESNRLAGLSLRAQDIEDDLEALNNLIANHQLTQKRGLERLFSSFSEADLESSRTRGELRSGRELADLDLYYHVTLPPGTSLGQVEELLAALNSLKSVEIAYASPPSAPPADLPPFTPDFISSQQYLGPAPTGIDAGLVWQWPGGRGEGVNIVDVELGWNLNHEELRGLFLNPSSSESEQEAHGSAVLGIVLAPENFYGVTGIAHRARGGVQFEGDPNRPGAIRAAGVAAGPGGVVLLEMQVFQLAPDGMPCYCPDGCSTRWHPVEALQAEFDAIAEATANGVIVVEAAGNGSVDLDHPHYGRKFDRAFRDSGAIMVGAGTSATRAPSCFTNFGSRIDLQGWGDSVVTLGAGDLFTVAGNGDQDYTSSFGGTSAASAIVTGAAAVLQGISMNISSRVIDSLEMRSLLSSTGTPQEHSSRMIGPLPNLRRAFDAMYPPEADFVYDCSGRSCTFDARYSTDNIGVVQWHWDFGDGNQTLGDTVSHTYTNSGTRSVVLTVTDAEGNSAARVNTVTVNDTPPVGRLTAGCTGLVCVADASTSSDDSPGLTFAFSWTGGTPTTFSPNPVATHTYAVSGPHRVVVSVRDSAGQTSTTSAVVTAQGSTRLETVGISKNSDEAKLRRYHEVGSGTDLKVGLDHVIGRPITGDWNGDSITTLGRYSASSATFFLRNINTQGPAELSFQFGSAGAGWLPISGDWNQDRVETVGLYDPTTATFRLRNANTTGTADLTFTFTGAASSWLPIAGDWNGDRIDTVGLFDPSTCTFYLRNSNSTGGADLVFVFGAPGVDSQPNAGDWNGDGVDTIGVFAPTLGTHRLRNTNSAGPADHQLEFGFNRGTSSLPLAGDWDGCSTCG